MYVYMVAYHHPSIGLVSKKVEPPENAVHFEQSVHWVHNKINVLIVKRPIWYSMKKKGRQRDHLMNQWLQIEDG